MPKGCSGLATEKKRRMGPALRLLRPVSGDHTMLCKNRVGTKRRDRCLTEVIRS